MILVAWEFRACWLDYNRCEKDFGLRRPGRGLDLGMDAKISIAMCIPKERHFPRLTISRHDNCQRPSERQSSLIQ